MIIDIHDVGHGACSVVTYPNGKRVMVDAGCRLEPYWSPSIHYRGQQMDLLVLQNLDEDHVQNLPYVLTDMSIMGLLSNGSVDANTLARMKQQFGMGAGVSKAHDLLRRYGPLRNHQFDLGTGWWQAFWNRYGLDFTDTNNLSVPIFFGWGGFSILFGGDLEEAGWKMLLKRPDFVARLRNVNVFVASHHGRENGCCEEVFTVCKPDLVVISDYEHQHMSQQTVQWYGRRTKGIVDNTRPGTLLGGPPRRYVMTTRSDGSLRFVVQPNGGFTVHTTPPPIPYANILASLGLTA